MARYIDADKLLQKLPNDLPFKASVKRVLIQAPAADVAEVVRCKNCIRWNDEYKFCKRIGLNGSCFEENDSCSYGKRRDE